MELQKVKIDVEDGTIDSVGGIKYNITTVHPDDLHDDDTIKVINVDLNSIDRAQIILTGAEFKKLKQLLEVDK